MNRVMLALDLDDRDRAIEVATPLAPDLAAIKVGPRLTLRDPSLITQLAKLAPVFLDHKFFDIPSTMSHATEASFELGAAYCTVHCLSGLKALTALANLERELSRKRPFHVVGVTLLTSFSQAELPLSLKSHTIVHQVLELVELGVQAGLTYFVCSGHEAPLIKNKFPQVQLIVPGIQVAGSVKNDQERVMTPPEAFKMGADYLVIGRSILQAPNPHSQLRDINLALAEAAHGLV